VSVCVLVTQMCCAKTVEPIEISFGGWTFVDPRNHVLSGGQDPAQEGGEFLRVVQPIEKHNCESLLWCREQNRSFSPPSRHEIVTAAADCNARN